LRNDVVVNDVLDKCRALKQSGLWIPEPKLRPSAWMSNFESEDKEVAAFLLDKFTFYSDLITNRLLVSSFHSIGDGLSKGPATPSCAELTEALSSAVVTPLNGERPNPTDSGYLMCRKARQVLDFPQGRIKDPIEAVKHAQNGGTVIFVDDFVGSGDQFLDTWEREYNELGNISFSKIYASSPFCAIYITLITTDFGLDKIHTKVPHVAVCAAHIITEKSTIRGIAQDKPDISANLESFLRKYVERLSPQEDYIARNKEYCVFGYKRRGLLFGFEHSIPDATLPIFWSIGDDSWEPLIERV